MSSVYRLADYRRKKWPVCFTRHELNLLLSIYSRRVISGEWKAYAIDHAPSAAQFSIFAHAGAYALYSVTKTAPSSRATPRFTVFKGSRRIAQAESLTSVLALFERDLRLVST